MSKKLSVAGACITITVALTSNVAVAAPDEMFQGKIAAIGDRMITVVTRRGENVSFVVPIYCMIRLDGKQISLTMLGMGNTVFVSAMRERGNYTAKHVEARSVEFSNPSSVLNKLFKSCVPSAAVPTGMAR